MSFEIEIKEGLLRSESALIQTIGRAARNSEAKVIMYADVITDSMKRAIDETNRRRQIQQKYNIEHNIVPKTIIKEVVNTIEISKKVVGDGNKVTRKEYLRELERLNNAMRLAASNLNFELALHYREEISKLKEIMKGSDE